MAYFDPRETPQQEFRRSSAAQLYKRDILVSPKGESSEFAEHEAQYATSKSYRDWVMKKAADNRLLDDKAREQELVKKLFDAYVNETQALSQQGTSIRRQLTNLESGSLPIPLKK